MRTIAAVLMIAAAAGVAAWPSEFFGYSSYGSTGCTGSVTGSTYHSVNSCEALTASSSIMYTDSGNGVIMTNTYATSGTCAGTAVTSAGNYTNNLCVSSFGSSTKYSVPAAGPFYSSTTWASTDCSGAASQVNYLPLNTCQGSSGSFYTYTASGHSITYCTFSDSACTAQTQCASFNSGYCATAGTGSVALAVNGAAAVAPQFVVAAAAVIIAAVGLSF